MTSLRVLDIVGPVCVAGEDGAILCRKSLEVLAQESAVLLDFTGVRSVTTSFLNPAINCIFEKYSPEGFRSRVRWTGLSDRASSVMDLVIEAADRFHAANVEAQNVISSAAQRVFED